MSLLPESSQLNPNDMFSECRSGKDLRQSCTIFSPRTVLIAVVGGQSIEIGTDDLPLMVSGHFLGSITTDLNKNQRPSSGI
jgi:hypothetical protein